MGLVGGTFAIRLSVFYHLPGGMSKEFEGRCERGGTRSPPIRRALLALIGFTDSCRTDSVCRMVQANDSMPAYCPSASLCKHGQ